MIFDFHISTFLITYCVILGITFLLYKKKKNKVYRFWFIAIFCFYILCLIKLVILPIPVYNKTFLDNFWKEFGRYASYYQPIPFKTILSVAKAPGVNLQIWGNILLLFPIPFFVRFLKIDKCISFSKALLIGFLSSISIEVIQLIIDIIINYPAKVMDVDDVILNTFGVLLGCITLTVVKKNSLIYNFIEKRILLNKNRI